MRLRITLLLAALMIALTMALGGAVAAFADSQPQSGQPGLTEGQNGPPPWPHH